MWLTTRRGVRACASHGCFSRKPHSGLGRQSSIAYSWLRSAFHAITSELVLQKLFDDSDSPAMFSPMMESYCEKQCGRISPLSV